MNQYSALKQALQPDLGWHGALNFVSSTVPTSFNQSQNRQLTPFSIVNLIEHQ